MFSALLPGWEGLKMSTLETRWTARLTGAASPALADIGIRCCSGTHGRADRDARFSS